MVLTGCSAGAIGVVHSCDWLGEQLQVPDYRCVADAPDLYDRDPAIAPGCYAREPEFQNSATEFWGRQLDQSCVEAATSSGETNIGEACGSAFMAGFLVFIVRPWRRNHEVFTAKH